MSEEEEELQQLLRVKPDVVQTLLLYKIYRQLKQLGGEDSTLEGKLIKIKLTVTDRIKRLTSKDKYGLPWVSMTLKNMGPDPVHVYVNESVLAPKPSVNDAPIEKDETLEVDMKKPLIRKVYLFCDKGKTATVKIYAKR